MLSVFVFEFNINTVIHVFQESTAENGRSLPEENPIRAYIR